MFPNLSRPPVVAAECAVATPRSGLGCVFGLALPGDLGCDRVVRVHGSPTFSSGAGLFV
jgi:hypothetical protein